MAEDEGDDLPDPISAETPAKTAPPAESEEAAETAAPAVAAETAAPAVAAETAAPAVAAEPAAPTELAAAPAKPARRRASLLWWALPVLMVVEFYAYGRGGRLEICVGKEGETDFELVGQPRTDENRWRFPRCETREDLGLRSQHDEKVAEAVAVACRGATIFRNQGEAKACVAGEQGWQHRVESHFVPPWDPAYYRHLFWFLQ